MRLDPEKAASFANNVDFKVEKDLEIGSVPNRREVGCQVIFDSLCNSCWLYLPGETLRARNSPSS
jgi:hypothetical protein